MELSDLLNEKEWRKCRGADDATTDELVEAFAHFCSTYWTIRHPERGRIKFTLREAQEETVRTWIAERYSIVLKARQIGFSTLAAAFTFWETFFWGDRFVVMLSRTEREASKLLQKTKYGYKMMPQWMKVRGPELLSDNQLKMVFANDSSIESLPSGNDPARGESVYRVVIDEMAFLPNADEAWASIEPIRMSADVSYVSQLLMEKEISFISCGLVPRMQPTDSKVFSSRGQQATVTKRGTKQRNEICRTGSWHRSIPRTLTKRSCALDAPYLIWKRSGQLM